MCILVHVNRDGRFGGGKQNREGTPKLRGGGLCTPLLRILTLNSGSRNLWIFSCHPLDITHMYTDPKTGVVTYVYTRVFSQFRSYIHLQGL